MLRSLLVAMAIVATAVVVTPAVAAPIGPVRTVSMPGDPIAPDFAGDPGVAFDTDLDRYLAVFPGVRGGENTIGLWGHFTGPEGAAAAPAYRISSVGTGKDGRGIQHPRIAYSSTLKRYLAVFQGEPTTPGPNEWEIYGQWISPEGTAVGSSFMISSGEAGAAFNPQLVEDPYRGGFAVVYWTLNRPTGPSTQAVAQLVTPAATGPVHVISAGISGGRGGIYPSIAWNPNTNEFGAASLATGGGLIHYRLTPDLAPIGQPVEDGLADINKPSISWNPKTGEYLIAAPHSAGGDREIWGRRYDAALAPASDWTRLSALGPEGAAAYGVGVDVGTAASAATGRWFLGFGGVSLDDAHREGQFEIFARTASPLLDDATQPALAVSAMGADPGAEAARPTRELLTGTIATDPGRDRFLLVWPGTGGDGAATNEIVILSRLYGDDTPAPAPGPPAAPAAPPAAAPACTPKQRAYLTRTGAICAPDPVRAFRVAAVSQHGRLIRLIVTSTTKGQRISVRCISRCAKAARTAHATARGRTTTISLAALRRLRSRTTFEVSVAQRRHTTRYVRYRTDGGQVIKRTEAGCQPKGKRASC